MRLITGRIVLACAAALLAPLAGADVTVVQQFASDGVGGAMQLGAMDGTTTNSISGHNARFEMTMKLRNAMFGAMLPQGGNFLQIVRLDDDRLYDVDPSKKTYVERTFEETRAANDRMTQQMQREAANKGPRSESECQWTAPKTDVKKTGEHASIAGLDTEHVIASVSRTCTKENESCDFVFALDQWLATSMPGGSETQAFFKEYAKRLALEGDMNAVATRGARIMLSRFPDSWAALFKATDSLKGYPLKATMSMQLGGAQCKSASEAEGAGMSAGTPSAAHSANPGAAMASLFAKFKHKSADSSATSASTAPSTPGTPGMVDLLRVTTTTTSISTSSVSQDKLRVPAGFKKAAKDAQAGA
jgi:hypothetical protein